MTPPDSLIERDAANRAQARATLQARLVGKLAQDLAESRSGVLRQFKLNLTSGLARFLSTQAWLLPYRRRMRFARSANRRSPTRSLVNSGLLDSIGAGSGQPNDAEYAAWIAEIEPGLRLTSGSGEDPQVTFVVSCGPGEHRDALASTLKSVKAQGHLEWNVVLWAQDAAAVRSAAEDDSRVRIATGPDDLVSGPGAYFVQLCAGDQLAPDMIWQVQAALVAQQSAPQLIYCDDDRMTGAGERVQPRFKDAWNRDFLYASNYIGRVVVLHRAVFEQICQDGRVTPTGMSHAELVEITTTLRDDEILHIPHILLHLTGHPKAKAAETTPAFSQAIVAKGAQAIQTQTGVQRINWPLPETAPRVCLVIPTRDQVALLSTAVDSILRLTSYDSYDILIIDNGSQEQDTRDWLAQIGTRDERVRVLTYPHPFNYSAINNFAVQHTDAEIIGLLNNDIEVIHADWLEEMVRHAIRPEIGCVGAKLYFSDSSVQHAGVALGIGPVAGHIFAKLPCTQSGALNSLVAARNVSAVTGACLILRRALYDSLGGLDEANLEVTCNDVDLCLKARAAGFRNLWTPHAELFHHESASRGQDRTPEQQARLHREQTHMIATWNLRPGQDYYVNRHVFNWI